MLVLVCAALLQRAVEKLPALSAVGMYVVYAAGLFLPGDKLRDRLGNAVCPQASAERKHSELIRQPQPFSRGGALLDLDIGAQRISGNDAALGALEVFLSVGSGEQYLIRFLRQHSGRHSGVGIALVGDGFYAHSRRLTQHRSRDIAAGADDDIRLEFFQYLTHSSLCGEKVEIRSLCVPAYVLHRELALKSSHLHRGECISCLCHQPRFHSLGSADKKYLSLREYAFQLVGNGKSRVYVSGCAAGCKYRFHVLSPFSKINSALHVLIWTALRLSRTAACRRS